MLYVAHPKSSLFVLCSYAFLHSPCCFFSFSLCFVHPIISVLPFFLVLPLLLRFPVLMLSLLYGFLLFTCMPLSFSSCLPCPPFLSWVISLSYVCPSLYVYAFLLSLFQIHSARRLEMPIWCLCCEAAQQRWITLCSNCLVIKCNIHSSCTHRNAINVKGLMEYKSQDSTVHWAKPESQTSTCSTDLLSGWPYLMFYQQ